MLFDGTSKALVDKLEQVIRLIRSKGVGIYFITQSPTDIPDNILAQLGNRVQHALRAFTPKDQKDVRAVAQTFRANPEFKTEDAIMNLETGEALVSFLDVKGAPGVVERARMLFPLSQIGAVTDGQRLDIMNAAPARIKGYREFFDRESAYEVLAAVNEQVLAKQEEARLAKEEEKAQKEAAKAQKEAEKIQREEEREAARMEKEASKKATAWKRTIFGTLVGAVVSSVARSVGSNVGKAVTKSVSKTTTTSSGKKTTKKTAGGDILGKAAQSATTTATKKLTEEVLKSIFK